MNLICLCLVLVLPKWHQTGVQAANILGVFPLADRGINYLYQRLLKGLADRGHHVTFLSAHEFDLGIGNGSVHDVILSGFAEKLDNQIKETNYETIDVLNKGRWDKFDAVCKVYNKTLWHRSVRDFIKTNKKTFSAVIVDYVWSDSLMVFSRIFKCPLIVLSSSGLIDPYVNSIVGNPIPPSYILHNQLVKSSFSGELTFFERFFNLFLYFYDESFKLIHSDPQHNKIIGEAYKRRFKNSPPQVSELRQNISLVLLNSHSSIRQATPLVPNVIEIGGFHIDPPQELSEDLQEFLDGARSGAVYFSMGLNVRTRNLPEWRKHVFMNVFKRLNLRVVWKCDGEEFIDNSPKVMLRRWVPQRDILAHPNVKLFVNHGGHQSLLETVRYGVPVLMIPIFPENLIMAHQANKDGYALTLPYHSSNFTEDALFELASQLLKNPKYTRAARFRSKLFTDRALEPMDEALYWIEYVIRHNGAAHLRSAAASLGFLKFHMLDVALVLVALSWLSLYLCCRRKKNSRFAIKPQ